MDEMIRYIFGSLRCSETAMRVFAKTLRKQRSFNRSTVMVATVMTVNMLVQDLEIRSIRTNSFIISRQRSSTAAQIASLAKPIMYRIRMYMTFPVKSNL